MTDAQLAAEFARDLGTVILAALALWWTAATIWTAAHIIRAWRPARKDQR